MDRSAATFSSVIGCHSVVDIGAPNAAILNPGEPRSVYFGVQAQF
jgi:hypothetical protein